MKISRFCGRKFKTTKLKCRKKCFFLGQILDFVKSYRDDLPQPLNLSTELHEWAVFWKEEKTQKRFVPTSVSETLLYLGEKRWFPNIRAILCLIAVIPASSNCCERSISRLRLIKNYLRSTMSTNRLSDLALMSIHRNIKLDPEEVLDIFSSDYIPIAYFYISIFRI